MQGDESQDNIATKGFFLHLRRPSLTFDRRYAFKADRVGEFRSLDTLVIEVAKAFAVRQIRAMHSANAAPFFIFKSQVTPFLKA